MSSKLIIVLLVALVVPACSTNPQYFVADVSPDSSATLALLPLVNLSKYDEAGDIFSRSLLVELLDVNIFEVIDPGRVDVVVLQKRIRYTDRLPLATMQELGREIGTRFLLLGSVNEFEMVTDRISSIPLVSISLRIVECETGEIVWAATHTKRGDDSESIFGWGRIESLERLASVASKEIVQTLKKK